MRWEDALKQLSDKVQAIVPQDFSFEEMAYPSEVEPGEPFIALNSSEPWYFIFEPAEFAGTEIPATVWLYYYPTMRRVRLVGPNGQGDWEIESSDGVPFHKVLDEDSLKVLTKDLGQLAA